MKSVDHLLLMHNKFGQCLGVSHPLLCESTQLEVQKVQVAHLNVKLDEFFETETMGVSCTPKCGSCRCGSCPLGGKQYTIQEERELAMIEKGLKLNDCVLLAVTTRVSLKKTPAKILGVLELLFLSAMNSNI